MEHECKIDREKDRHYNQTDHTDDNSRRVTALLTVLEQIDTSISSGTQSGVVAGRVNSTMMIGAIVGGDVLCSFSTVNTGCEGGFDRFITKFKFVPTIFTNCIDFVQNVCTVVMNDKEGRTVTNRGGS